MGVVSVIKSENVRFPISGEYLALLQRIEVGRELTATEREFFGEVADMANESYSAATRGDVETVHSFLDAINATAAADPYSLHLAALCRGWVLLGYQKGTEQLKAATGGDNYSS